MKHRIFTILSAAILLATTAEAQRWTSLDKIGVASGAVLIAADWSLTLHQVRNGATERNPLLGMHPSEGRINVVAGTTLLAYIGASLVLPKEERRMLMGIVLAAESFAVTHNLMIGARFGLP